MSSARLLVQVDVSKAFGVISHGILITELRRPGASPCGGRLRDVELLGLGKTRAARAGGSREAGITERQ